MHDALTFFEILVYILMLEYTWVLVLWYIVSHVVYTYYFWMNGVKFPFLGLIPFGRAFLYRSLSGINMTLVIFYSVFTAAACYLPSVIIWLIWLLLSFLLEWRFAQSCIDDKQILYALVAPYKLYRLFTDARALSDIESEE